MIIKKIFIALFTILVFLGAAISVSAQTNTVDATNDATSSKIYLFYGTGCSHCAEVEEYFEKENIFDEYSIEKKEIYFDRDNAVLFNNLLGGLGIPSNERGVPTVVIGDKAIIGSKLIIDNFVIEADKFLENKTLNEGLDNPDDSKVEGKKLDQSLDLTLAAVIGASIVDAINPCAFAVLIILMSTILATGDGKKALKTGLAFAASIFISYFLMGLGLYKALGIGKVSSLFFGVIGWLAIIIGILNLKDYFWYGKGFLMEVPMSWRPKMKKLIKSVTSPSGAFMIGFLISLFLLPCTSGPYIVILGMLAETSTLVKAIFYLIIYNLIFVLPMILISLAVYKGFSPEKAEEIRQKHLRVLHLVAGIIMILMGVVVLNGWI